MLVNLGYGNIGGITDGLITGGWNPGPADAPAAVRALPEPQLGRMFSPQWLNGLQQGISAAITDLQNPDNYQISLESEYCD